jgi:hypothetical protein
MMTLQDMIDNFPSLSAGDLLKLNKAAADAWNARGDELRKAFRVGDRVTFLDRSGERMFGIIAKVMRKNIKVDVNGNELARVPRRIGPGIGGRAMTNEQRSEQARQYFGLFSQHRPK